MRRFYKWIQMFSWLICFIAFLGTIIYTEKKHVSNVCKKIELTISSKENQQFISEHLLLARLTETYADTIVGREFKQIASKKIENTINSDNFVGSCSVYKSWDGSLKITVVPKRPIARIIGLNKPGQYIDETGDLLPLSAYYTAQVLVLHDQNLLHINKNLKESEYGLALFNLLKLIDQNNFWKTQINQIHIDAKQKLFFSTQFGQQTIIFGSLEKIEEKMKKLNLFYKIILPYKGWNRYKRVNLEFDQQIVCE